MRKVLSIQDISCVGKCSLTVSLPLISCMGVECQILPTSLLSTHTMFKSYSFLDLTEEMLTILNHFELNEFKFDALCSGYLGSIKQIEILKAIASKYRNDKCFYVCDPVMADAGKLYKGFDMSFVKEMFELCKCADIIVPNITEACFMLGIEYKERMSQEEIEHILRSFEKNGIKNVLLTGVAFKEDELGIALLHDGEIEYHFNQKISRNFHGSGDIFASVFVGALLREKTMFEASALAADFVCEAIKMTLKEKDHNEYGLNFEQVIPYLVDRIR